MKVSVKGKVLEIIEKKEKALREKNAKKFLQELKYVRKLLEEYKRIILVDKATFAKQEHLMGLVEITNLLDGEFCKCKSVKEKNLFDEKITLVIYISPVR